MLAKIVDNCCRWVKHTAYQALINKYCCMHFKILAELFVYSNIIYLRGIIIEKYQSL